MSFSKGLKDGLPIGLGYLAVSFAFGIFCMTKGLTPLVSIIMSLTNLTSAGQFAGVELIYASASILEIGLTTLLINLRYSLMSIALSQKLDSSVKLKDKLVFGFGITDEVFAIASTKKNVTSKYMYGLILLPIIGWTLGTTLGCISSNILPSRVLDAFGISLYSMFIAIFIPDCRKKLGVVLVVILSAILSIMFYYIPYLNKVSAGFVIIICTIIASVFGALVFPVNDIEEDKEDVSNS